MFEARNNFSRRVLAIKAEMLEYFENIHKDAITYLQEKLITRVIDGQYVGVITGNLRRSMQVEFFEYHSEMEPNFSVAPYARFVADWAKGKFGKNYYGILVDLYGSTVNRLMKKEFSRMIKLINDGKKYRYQNPFPA